MSTNSCIYPYHILAIIVIIFVMAVIIIIFTSMTSEDRDDNLSVSEQFTPDSEIQPYEEVT